MGDDQNFDTHSPSLRGQNFASLRDAVMSRWEREARAQIPSAESLPATVLNDQVPALIGFIAQSFEPTFQDGQGSAELKASALHGATRARITQFGPDQVVKEYQLLRQAFAAEAQSRLTLTNSDWAAIDNFINLAICESVHAFASTQEDLRRKLAAAILHDLRTPLTVVVNGAQILQRSKNVAVTQVAEKIASNADRLQDMVAELLDALTFSSGEKLPLNLSTFDMATLVKEVCAEYNQMRPGEIRSHSEPVQGFWCSKSMRRALENLINNAEKHGDGTGVDIVETRSEDKLFVSVHNFGTPIPEGHQVRIFDYFTRNVGATASAGWGLGLPFVKRVAESHGGSVAVESSLENGTTFIIEIPIDCRPYVDVAH